MFFNSQKHLAIRCEHLIAQLEWNESGTMCSESISRLKMKSQQINIVKWKKEFNNYYITANIQMQMI